MLTPKAWLTLLSISEGTDYVILEREFGKTIYESGIETLSTLNLIEKQINADLQHRWYITPRAAILIDHLTIIPLPEATWTVPTYHHEAEDGSCRVEK